MKLNLTILCDHLSRHFLSKYYGREESALTLDRPVLFAAGAEMIPGILYVARESDLPTNIPHGIFVICVGKQIPAEWQTMDNHFLLISDEKDPLTVFQEVHNIFNQFDAWEHRIFEELLNHTAFDIKRIMHLGTELLQNPLAIMDPNMRLIFSSDITETAQGIMKINVSDRPVNLSRSVSLQLKEVCQLERENKTPYLSALTIHNASVYCYNLYPFGTFAGCLCLIESFHQFQRDTFALCDYFFSLFNKAFFKYLRESEQKESPGVTGLCNLLNHKPLNAEEYEYLMLQKGQQYICFKLKEKPDRKNMPKDYMCATFRSAMPQIVLPLIYQEDLLGLIRLPEDHSKQSSILLQFQEILTQMEYTAGCSNAFTDIHLFDNYLLQAEFATEQCSKECSCSFFYEHILSFMLHECTDKLPRDALLSKGLVALMEYDQKKGTEYGRTLKIFLKNERNITHTASELYIHRSTLLKRLSKIRALTGEDLNDPDIRLYYQIIFRLPLRQLQQFPSTLTGTSDFEQLRTI